MAHSLRAAAVAGTLAFAALAVRCEPQTFDLLPEYGAGTSGKPSTGGKGNSNTGGMFGNGGAGGNAGRSSGGKASGGQFNSGGQFIGGAPSIIGGSTFMTGGRTNLMTGGATADFKGCGDACPSSGCIPCIPGPDDGNCPDGLLCPLAGTPLAQSCQACVACRTNGDCVSPISRCDTWTRTCTQPCSKDEACTVLPQRQKCALDPSSTNSGGICSECKGEDLRLCPNNRLCTPHNTCRDCIDNNDCKQMDPSHPICDQERNRCVECTDMFDCRTTQRPKCDTVKSACVECNSAADCQFSQQQLGAVCFAGACTCSSNEQCVGSPFGKWCVLGHCHECMPQQQCANGQICDSNGNCPH